MPAPSSAALRGAIKRLLSAVHCADAVQVMVNRRDLEVLMVTFVAKRPDQPVMHPDQK